MGKRKNKTSKMFFIIGSILITIGGIIVAPKIINYISDLFYKKPDIEKDDENWGPEIVKKQNEEHTEDGKL